MSEKIDGAVAWTVVGPDGETSIGGWLGMQTYETSRKWATLREGHRYAFAYPQPAAPNETSGDERSALAALVKVWDHRAAELEERAREADSIGEMDKAVAVCEARAGELTRASRELAFALHVAAGQPAAGQHPDNAAVDNFAVAMKAKMAAARAKGRSGWEDPSKCSAEDLSRMLRDHVWKGDPRDVANFCMMLHQRGEAITPIQPVGQESVSIDVVRKFIADRAPNDEHREDVLSGDYDHTAWFGHIRELMEALAAPPAKGIDPAQFKVVGTNPRVNPGLDSYLYAVECARSQIGPCRPDRDEPEDQWYWDKLTGLMRIMNG